MPLKEGLLCEESPTLPLHSFSSKSQNCSFYCCCRNRSLANMKLSRRAGLGCRNCFQLIWGAGREGGRQYGQKGPHVGNSYDSVCIINILGTYSIDSGARLLGSKSLLCCLLASGLGHIIQFLCASLSSSVKQE